MTSRRAVDDKSDAYEAEDTIGGCELLALLTLSRLALYVIKDLSQALPSVRPRKEDSSMPLVPSGMLSDFCCAG